MTETDPLVAEFDTVAAWTAEAIRALGPEHAIPGACRGSGSPSSLAWLAESMQIGPDSRLLDIGSGLGGPAAWLVDHYRAEVVAVEPMPGATQESRALFGLPAAVAWSESLPFATGSFDAAWALGVLCTAPDPRQVLAEVSRVLRPARPLGLIAYLLESEDVAAEMPAGDRFPTVDAFTRDLEQAGFAVVAMADASAAPPAPVDWVARTDRVVDLVEEKHGDHPAHAVAKEQEARIGRLLGEGHLRAHLVHSVSAR